MRDPINFSNAWEQAKSVFIVTWIGNIILKGVNANNNGAFIIVFKKVRYQNSIQVRLYYAHIVMVQCLFLHYEIIDNDDFYVKNIIYSSLTSFQKT